MGHIYRKMEADGYRQPIRIGHQDLQSKSSQTFRKVTDDLYSDTLAAAASCLNAPSE